MGCEVRQPGGRSAPCHGGLPAALSPPPCRSPRPPGEAHGGSLARIASDRVAGDRFPGKACVNLTRCVQRLSESAARPQAQGLEGLPLRLEASTAVAPDRVPGMHALPSSYPPEHAEAGRTHGAPVAWVRWSRGGLWSQGALVAWVRWSRGCADRSTHAYLDVTQQVIPGRSTPEVWTLLLGTQHDVGPGQGQQSPLNGKHVIW